MQREKTVARRHPLVENAGTSQRSSWVFNNTCSNFQFIIVVDLVQSPTIHSYQDFCCHLESQCWVPFFVFLAKASHVVFFFSDTPLIVFCFVSVGSLVTYM